jgi:hypothetical protein
MITLVMWQNPLLARNHDSRKEKSKTVTLRASIQLYLNLQVKYRTICMECF